MALFWGIYFVDREMVYPQELDKYIPAMLNHCWHTLPLFSGILEALVVFHRYPSHMTAVSCVFVFSTLYIIWIVWVFTNANIWPYPFFKLFPLPSLPLFFLANFIIAVMFQLFARVFCYLRWKGD